MNHNYTILITGTLTESQEQTEPLGLATFAFADNDASRIAELKQLAESGQLVRLACPSCVMLGRLELFSETDLTAVFHFHLDKLKVG